MLRVKRHGSDDLLDGNRKKKMFSIILNFGIEKITKKFAWLFLIGNHYWKKSALTTFLVMEVKEKARKKRGHKSQHTSWPWGPTVGALNSQNFQL